MSIFCSSGEQNYIELFLYSANGLSVFGSVMVLMTYIMLPKLLNNKSRRLLAYLNLSNLFYGAIEIFLYHSIFTEQNIPQDQSFVVFLFVIYCFKYSTYLWPLILAINLYQIVAKYDNNLSHLEFLWLFIGFIFPIIIVFIMKCFGLVQFHETLIITTMQYIIPVIFIAFFILLTYIKLIKASKFAFEEEEARKFIRMIIPYPIITVIISIPYCAFNILYSSSGCFTLFLISLLSIRCLQGFFEALVFGFNPTVREEWKSYFRKNDEEFKLIL